MAKADDPAALGVKKKRADDEPSTQDQSQRPIQLQRRRVWRACESCRRKKIKCDGCEPTCSQCAASGSQCTWLQTKDRAALSRHYVQELEARLLHMESLFSQIAPVLESIGPNANGSNGAGPSTAPAPPASIVGENAAPVAAILRTIAPKQPPSEPVTPIKPEDDVSESFGQLALDEYGHMRWIGGSSTMSLIQSFRALTSSPLHRISPMEEDPYAPGPSVNKLYFPAAVFFGKIHALPGPEEVEYPERDLADKLVEAYFARFHFLMPVVDKPSFMRDYTTLMDNNHDHTYTRTQTAFLSLLFAVFACAANLVQDPRLSTSERQDDGGMGMVYYERALILQYISHASIQIAHVQCFILMSSFLCSVNCLPQAWILIGQAVRAGQDLGLHRSPRRLLVTPVEKETRRKIWWGVYTLDRMLALALGRPLGINDSDCDVELPVDVDDEHLPEYFTGAPMNQRQPSLMKGSIELIKLYEIGGRVLREVYHLDNCRDHLEPERKVELQRTVESLDNELTKWCDDLPAVFKSQSETDEQVSMGAVLCSHYYSVLTTLHRNLLPVKRDQPVTAKSTVKAVSSARSCIRLAPSMKHVVPPSHHLAFFIQHLFSSAVIVLLYAMHSSDPRAATAALEEAKSTLSALESWEGQWPGARKCKELLQELTNTANEAIAQGTREKANPTVAPASTVVPTRHERRKSVTLATSGSGSAPPGRVVKPRTRRNQSRDPGTTSSRRLAAVSPYRVDSAQRARSTSRKRGGLDDEVERSGAPVNYYQSFSSPRSAHAASSTHSSPASVNLPSPSMPVLDNSQDPSPRMANTYTFATPVSPVQQPSPPQYEHDYTMQSTSTLNPSNLQHWNGNETTDNRGMELYPTTPQDPTLYTNPYNAYNLDGSYSGFEQIPEMNGGMMTGLSTTPPSASFAAPGLPFRGLDYIRNYNPGGYSAGDQDSLWQSYDPGAFGYDPDVPFFNIGDATNDVQDGVH
ncbi:fungal-specific transcription factor domain-containing protein [Crucibulum laeve]|uniref:Fungal-specific transcription factor domain-containing protein n=1 Tax=Crucibulum laeve TaxID=68775 RepID=A0A5C3MCI6_9AGAR|nr:fungal-specific transcription factor domain-containing protein [Crucibulum laeve]